VGGEAISRIVVLVLDGVGIGALPDAGAFGDEGTDTLGNLARTAGGLSLPALERLGLGAVAPVEGLKRRAEAGAYGMMAERSVGKDSTTGHWELAGLEVTEAFPTFPQGFPPAFVEAFERRIGRSVLGNRPASGTVIIEELGSEHMLTGNPILYTSADSVFQLAAHEAVIGADSLYDLCRRARDLLDEMGLPVLRVIARPYTGEAGAYRRFGRKDFSLPPPGETVLDRLQELQCPVLGIGKVGDLFCGRGFDEVWTTAGNEEGEEKVARALAEWPRGLVLANLMDFDTLYGHRKDIDGFAEALREFDTFLGGRILPALSARDLLVITADHGCDPTRESTDHSREYVPLLVAAQALNRGVPLGKRETFADVAATVFEILVGGSWPRGASFWPEVENLWEREDRRAAGRPGG
jgi:phosphopentomutase